MSTIAKDSGGGDFDPVPQGIHLAICIMVIDGGTQYNKNFDNSTHQVKLVWEVPEQTVLVSGETVPMTIQQNYTLSLNKKANLRKALENWRGVSFSDQELQGFDLKAVLGKPCQINVIHNTVNDKTFANIGAILPLAKGMTVPPHAHDLLYFDLDAKTDESWNALPLWIQNWIGKCSEMQPNHAPASMGNAPPVETYDDIPF